MLHDEERKKKYAHEAYERDTRKAGSTVERDGQES